MSEKKILNKYIELIEKGYCCACNELNCIDNFPQKKIANAISNLQQENKQLKEEVAKLKEPTTYFKYASKSVVDENKQLKEVIEEVREVVKELELHYQQHPTMIPSVKLNKLLQILDKVKGE